MDTFFGLYFHFQLQDHHSTASQPLPHLPILRAQNISAPANNMRQKVKENGVISG